MAGKVKIPQFVTRPKFIDYKEQYKEHFIFERKNGIIQMRMHTDDGPVQWSHPMHNALGMVWNTIGRDPENEVLILTSTGPYWIAKFDIVREEELGGGFSTRDRESGLDVYDLQFYDSTVIVENFIFDLDIPTISVVPGPGIHTELALLCDITLCSETAVFQDGHFMTGAVPGDGQGLVFQGLLGKKHANYYMYTGQPIDAKTALELGLVNEVLPADKLLPRAWEMAEEIMRVPRVVRRLTSQLIRRPWKRLFLDDFQVHIASEFFAWRETQYVHQFDEVKKTWEK
jgi:enoyl-CoA hydratase/carnithine racemase